MNLLLPLLPAKVRPYAKTVLAALGTILTAVAVLVPEVPTWVTLVLSALTALGVYVQPNAAASKAQAVADAVSTLAADAAAKIPALAPVLPLVAPEVAKITTALTGSTDPVAVPPVTPVVAAPPAPAPTTPTA